MEEHGGGVLGFFGAINERYNPLVGLAKNTIELVEAVEDEDARKVGNRSVKLGIEILAMAAMLRGRGGKGGKGSAAEGGRPGPGGPQATAPAATGARALPELPKLDGTGKVHGKLPQAKDLVLYDTEDLIQLRNELQASVQKRIEVTVKKGSDFGHAERQAAEQQLIRAIDKHLEDR
jgi:hypothetical protein